MSPVGWGHLLLGKGRTRCPSPCPYLSWVLGAPPLLVSPAGRQDGAGQRGAEGSRALCWGERPEPFCPCQCLLSPVPVPFVPSCLGGQLGTAPSLLQARGMRPALRCWLRSRARCFPVLPPSLPALPCPSLPPPPSLRALFLCAPPAPSPPLRRQPPLRGPAPLPAGGGDTGGGRRGTPLLGAAPALPHGGDPPPVPPSRCRSPGAAGCSPSSGAPRGAPLAQGDRAWGGEEKARTLPSTHSRELGMGLEGGLLLEEQGS